MPPLSKRKKQLQKVCENKRQKLQELENQDPEQGEEEVLGSLSDYESENDYFKPENEELDEEAMIYLYFNEWIDNLHRDYLM